MGLDLFDLTLRIEEEFGVALEMSDLEQIVDEQDLRAGALCVLIEQRRRGDDFVRTDLATSRQVWERLRRAFAVAIPGRSDGIDLSTPLDALLPRPTRRDDWERLRAASPFPLPELLYPRWVQQLGWALALTATAAELLRLWWWLPVGAGWLLAGLLGVLILIGCRRRLLWLLRPWQIEFPVGWRTVKDLCRQVLRAERRNLAADADVACTVGCGAAAVDLWPRLRQVLSELLGVDEREVLPESRLWGDLGMD